MLIFIISIWWDYNKHEYQKKEDESHRFPVFVLHTLPTCPHCKGLPEKFKSFAEGWNNKSKIIFTHVDCEEEPDLCSKGKIYSIPQFLLIKGRNPEYWKKTGVRTKEEWTDFLNENVKKPYIEIKTQKDFDNHVKQVENGFSAFHLKVYRNDHNLKGLYKEIAYAYTVFGCHFSYEFVDEISSIRSYYSRNCYVEQTRVDMDSIQLFIDSTKFSDFHKYSMPEIDKRKEYLIFGLTVTKSLLKSQITALSNFSDMFCKRIRFGWFEDYDKAPIHEITDKTHEDSPYFLVMNKFHNCFLTSKRRLSHPFHIRMLDASITGNKIVNETDIIIVTHHNAFKTIIEVVLVFIIVGCIVIYFKDFTPKEIAQDIENVSKIE